MSRQENGTLRAGRASFFQVQKRIASTSQLTDKTTSSISTAQPSATSSDKHFKPPSMSLSETSGSASKTPLIVRFYDYDIQAKDALGRTQEEILSWSDIRLERSHNYIQMLFPLPEGSPYNFEAPIVDREVMLAFRSRSELRNRLRQSFERMLEFYGFTGSIKVAVNEAEEKENNEIEDKKTQAESEQIAETADVVKSTSEGNIQSITAPHANSKAKTPVADPDAAVIADATINTTDDSTGISRAASEASDAQQLNPSPPIGYHIVRGPNWRRNSRNWVVRFDHNHLRITRILRCVRILGLQAECDAFFKALQHVFDDPATHISDRSMMYWQRAVTRPLHIAPDDDRCSWLKKWEDEQEAQKTEVKQGTDDYEAREKSEDTE